MAIPPIATLYLNQGHEGEHFARALLDVIQIYVPSECPEDSCFILSIVAIPSLSQEEI